MVGWLGCDDTVRIIMLSRVFKIQKLGEKVKDLRNTLNNNNKFLLLLVNKM